MEAAFLLVKLIEIESWDEATSAACLAWHEEMPGGKRGEIILPVKHPQSTDVYHLFVIRTARRHELVKHLSESNIETQIHYPVPPHLQECYKYLGL